MDAVKTLDRKGIAELLGYSVIYVRNNVTKRPDFPAPYRRLSTHNVVWRESDVRAWMDRVTQAA